MLKKHLLVLFQKDKVMNKSISRILTLTKRNIKEIIRDPLSLVFIIGLPLVMEVLFYFFEGMVILYLVVIICPNCTCTQLFLVPSSFFVFCCLEEAFVQMQALQPWVPGP